MSETAENRPVAIHVSGVKKMYKLGQIGGGTLQADLQSWWARKRGKEDPNLKIGEGERSHGDTFMALNGIDLTIYQGEAVGIIGSNGAGKSTLLKLLSRVTAPTEGDIDIYGRIASMLEVGTGFNGELTGRENVYMNGAILGMTKAEIDAKMEEIIEFSEVSEFIDTPVKRYSSGMFVKLAFSVAAHLDAEIMIMDEVLAVGDIKFQQKCLERMREAAHVEKRTVLYVSHNMSTIRQLCKRVIVLDSGKVIYDGDMEAGIARYITSGGEIEGRWIYSEKDERIQLFGKATISEVSLDKTEHPVYEQLEHIKIKIRWKPLIDDMKVYFRVLPVLLDDSVVGVSFADSCVTTKKYDEYTQIIDCNFDGLVPDKYYLNITLFEVNDYGMDDYVAVLKKCVSFELLQNSSIDLNINYDPKKYNFGRVRFPNAKIMEGDISGKSQ